LKQEKPKPDASGQSGAIAPGRVSAFLAELARVPDVDPQEILGAYRPGAVIGRFELLRELGRGGFGVVFEALDRELGRRVAFKAIRPGRPQSARLKEEWLRSEAEAAAQLSHPNIVQLYDFGLGPRGPYLVLELLEGETLQDRLQRGPLPAPDAIRISIQMAQALAHSHAAGVLHRDLKPSNVFLAESGAVKVLDFGLARVLGASRLQAGGTPAYMAPEQWREEPEDARTDLFGAGAILYEMLTGRAPYSLSGGRSAVLDPGPAPVPHCPGLPRKVGALVSRAIARRQADRPANAQVWLDGLLAAERAIVRAGRTRARRMAWVAAAVLATVSAGAGFHAWRQARARPPPARWPERVTVAVADFTNESGDSELDGLSGMLITSLEQSRHLSVLSRSRMIDVLRQLGREDAVHLDEPLAREIGRRTGVRALLIGSIRRFEGIYRLELRALDPLQDAYLFGVQEQGSGKANIPSLIDRLSEQTRQRLREGAEEVRSSEVKVAEAVTPSIEAYQHYFLGLDCLERPSRHPSHPEGCVEELRRAVAIDPDFVLAWFRLSMVGWDELVPAVEDRGRAIDRALRLADRVPPKERTLMRAWKAHLDGDDERALALCREVTIAFPEDKQALYLTGDILWHREDLAAAAPYLARVLELDPTFEFALDHLSYALAVLGRRDELGGWVRTWAAMAPSPPVMRALVQGRLGLGEARAAVAAARRAAETGPGEYALTDLARALFFEGDYAAIESELRARGPLPLVQRFFLAHAVAAQGRRAEALRLLDAIARTAADEDRHDIHFVRAMHLAGDGDAAAVWTEARWLMEHGAERLAIHLATPLARLGDLSHARQLADLDARGSPSREIFLATLDWKEGHPVEARARLQALERRYPLPHGGIAPAFLRAEVAAEEGLDAEVVEALRALERLPFQGHWRSWAYPQGLYLFARSLERLGRREEARAEVDRLQRLWARADPGLPLLKRMRALRARLDASAARKTASEVPIPSRLDGGSPSGVNPK